MGRVRRRSVAILGTAPGWQHGAARYWQPGWEVWGLNAMWQILPRTRWGISVDRYFELHGRTRLTNSRRPPDHWRQLAALEMPVYYLRGKAPSPRAVKFPLARVRRAFGGINYFACTFAYQIAFALVEGFTRIELYGAPLVGAREALVEQPCVAYWLGVAAGRGVQVHVEHAAKAGLLLHPYRYADQDARERRHTYGYAMAVYRDLSHWLLSEEARLWPDGPSFARDGRVKTEGGD